MRARATLTPVCASCLVCAGVGGLQHSMSYWLGKAENEQLLRVYGISFPENKLLKDWVQFREEAAKRDHRLIGRVWQESTMAACPGTR